MSEGLVNSLKEVLIEHGIKIIFATHNPSTVAACDEKKDGIFVIEKSRDIKEVSKNKAINILSDGIVTLEEGLNIFSTIEKDIILISEGKNYRYFEKFLELFQLKDKVGLVRSKK